MTERQRAQQRRWLVGGDGRRSDRRGAVRGAGVRERVIDGSFGGSVAICVVTGRTHTAPAASASLSCDRKLANPLPPALWPHQLRAHCAGAGQQPPAPPFFAGPSSPPALSDASSGCGLFTGPWTVARSSFACCVGSMRSDGRGGRCSLWRVRRGVGVPRAPSGSSSSRREARLFEEVVSAPARRNGPCEGPKAVQRVARGIAQGVGGRRCVPLCTCGADDPRGMDRLWRALVEGQRMAWRDVQRGGGGGQKVAKGWLEGCTAWGRVGGGCGRWYGRRGMVWPQRYSHRGTPAGVRLQGENPQRPQGYSRSGMLSLLEAPRWMPLISKANSLFHSHSSEI